jgi:hypothetical protein
MQTLEYAGPFAVSNPDYTGAGWAGYGSSPSHVDAADDSGYQSDDRTGQASLAQTIVSDDGVIPTRAKIRTVVVEYRLGQDALAAQGALPVVPYVRFADGAPVFEAPITVPYTVSFADYQARFPVDPNGLPWTRGTIFRLRGQQLRFGLRTAVSELFSAQVLWSETRFLVEFDLPVPLVVTDPASLISNAGARLNGRFNPRSANGTYPCSYWFEYGETTAYGSSTVPGTGATGDADLTVAADVSGLDATTGYHFRLVVSTADGTYYGEDQFFTTGDATLGRWRLDEFKRVASGEFTASDRTRITSYGFDRPSTSTDDSTCPFLVYP